MGLVNDFPVKLVQIKLYFKATYNSKSHRKEKSKKREIDNECGSIEQNEEIFQGACRLCDDSEYCNKYRATGDENGADDHPRGKYIP